ncbi:hypothetical protein [Kitasatospora terrestris]|uniref:Doubled CXXCH motif domain-containing protein n=1 Tax=Kitasatospora terrestris TaxID=258051 RepID=A0ABP9EJL9_9ACTN
MQLSYALVTEEDFPGGLACSGCHRPIAAGQPYSETVGGMLGDTPVVELVCVYC